VNLFTKAMVAVTGHRYDASVDPRDVGGLSKIGLSICFASILAAIQFGIAGWFLASGMSLDSRYLFAEIFAVIGALVVLIVDRNFIYAADTSSQSKGYVTYAYLAIRVFLILVISSLSSQFTLPLLLKSELEIHVQDLKDERYDAAKNRYNNKYELAAKVQSERELGGDITRLKGELTNLPQSLVHQKLASQQCMREYRKKINSSIGPDVDEEEVSNLYGREKIQCEQIELAYKEAYRLYITPKQAELALKNESYKHVLVDVNQAQNSFKNDLQKADQNNSQFLNASSSDVLWSLVRSNPGARMKYIMLTLVQMILELMPLLLKSILGQSPVGIQIALRNKRYSDALEESQHHSRMAQIDRLGEQKRTQFAYEKEALEHRALHQKLKNHISALKQAPHNFRINEDAAEKIHEPPSFASLSEQNQPLGRVRDKEDADLGIANYAVS